jgi:uncharacterized protein with ParB-like and HNH nuclease domain
MKGTAIPLSQFVDSNRVQFIIPVYQRNYDWKIENCDQLFNDLVRLIQTNRQNHFFGSIVTSIADEYGHNRLVIDGQQRLTTISLLIMAGIKAVKDGKLAISNKTYLEEAKDLFLITKYASSDRTLKLVPIEKDRDAYDRIFHYVENTVEDPFTTDCKINRNFKHFYSLLTSSNNSLTFDNLIKSIERLQIISIELGADDDAQLIFESLNSTGLALSEADKIRNYLLMSLSSDDQQIYFKDYWQKIESATDNQPTMFLRDYLTIMQQSQRHARIGNIYFEWKKYMQDKERKDELPKMLAYSQYYRQITKAEFSSHKLSEKMSHICNIETDIANVFFIQFLKYADDNSLPESEIYKVFDLIENYMARRIICNIPSNALTQVFCALHKDVIKSIEEYEKAEQDMPYTYSEILTYHIMRRDGNYQLPRDIQFVDSIKNRDAYHMNKQFQIFLFERLENSVRGEYNDVSTAMKSREATIEHIMPQTLSDKWIAMLGPNYKTISETYLHTFANLTITGINSELSNKPFNIKRDGETLSDGSFCPGYINSKYRLTRSVTTCQQWTETELINRGQEIVNTFLSLYPLPTSTFTPIAKSVEEISLEEEAFNPTSRNLKGFILFNNEYAETTWKGMLVKVVMAIADLYPDLVDSLYDTECFFWTPNNNNNIDLNYCTQIGDNKYLWTTIDNKGKLRCLRYLFEKCNIAESELTLILEPIKDN